MNTDRNSKENITLTSAAELRLLDITVTSSRRRSQGKLPAGQRYKYNYSYTLK